MTCAFNKQGIEKIYGSPFIGDNKITLLYRGEESFDAIFRIIKEAREIVALQFYIFRNDETGTEMADLLMKKAGEGVKIYLLRDHFGSLGIPKVFWDRLKKAGIRVRVSRPFKWLSPLYYIHRDHRKLIIIDGKMAVTGGFNIANEYRGFHLKTHRKGWRDTGLILEGPIVSELYKTFRWTWKMMGGVLKSLSDFPPLRNVKYHESGLPVIPIFASSSRGRRRMRRLLYYSINHASESILLTTAYFTPSRRMLYSLEEAVRRGVDVRLLLPGPSDVPPAQYAGRAFFTRLLSGGIRIYNYQGKILHAKSYVFDQCWSIVGSANLDFLSLRWNDEGNVGILDRGFTARMKEVFEEDTSHSIEIKLEEWKRRPLSERLKEKFFVLFRRRL